ncbi:MAG: DUF222 domain-containing protein [Nocardioides sp.]
MSTTTPPRDAGAPSAGVHYAGVHPVPEQPVLGLLREVLSQVASVDGQPGANGRTADAARIDQIRMLEVLKATAAAAQAKVTRAFEASQLAQQRAAGVPQARRGRGIGDQVALARGVPASQGSRHLGLAKALAEMPHTEDLLSRGDLSEWTATLLVRETAAVSLENRKLVDERLCAMSANPKTGEVVPPNVIGLTPKRAAGAARAMATQLDPESAVRRCAQATEDRRVTIRPAPDTMTYVTGLLPVTQGVAVYANLRKSAGAMRAAGDPRGLGQLMADLLVERLTGQASAAAVPLEVSLVMTPDTLFGFSDQPARTAQGDTVPAETARNAAWRPDAPTWLRRLFTDPVTGVVIGTDSRRRKLPSEDRFFRGADRRDIEARDQECRHPLCDSSIEEGDHVTPVAAGGPTNLSNGQGLCQAHNLVKETPGWQHRVIVPDPSCHTVEVITPTGHTYRSQAPPGLPQPP